MTPSRSAADAVDPPGGDRPDDPPGGGPPGPGYLSPAEFARHSGLSLVTVRRYLKKGCLPFRQTAGKGSRVLIPRDALERPAPAGGATPPSATGSVASEEVPSPTTRTRASKPSGPTPPWMKRAGLR